MTEIRKLPSMEHTFTISAKGSETGQHFDGTFTYKRPNLRIKSDIAKTSARLNEDMKNLDEDTSFVHRILATLRHTLVKSPEWWTNADHGYDLYDVNVVLEIYKACREFEDDWFDKVWVKTEDPKPNEKDA